MDKSKDQVEGCRMQDVGGRFNEELEIILSSIVHNLFD